VGLLWAYKATTGLQELVAVGIIFATTSLILAFVRDFERFRTVMWAWVVASVLVGVLSMTTSFTEVAATGQTWEIAAQGGRETGLGQQPNWFAMNLMFGVLSAFALALTYKKATLRAVLVLAGLFIFFAQLRSGSRGGAYAIVIGGGLMALANPVFRKWMLRFAAVAVLVFTYQIAFGDNEATRKAFMRIWMNLDTLWRSDVRARNWLACIHMFQNTHGLGIGAGGYAQVIADYDWRIYDSIHRYPHGIPWGILAHYGVIGLGCATWLVVRVAKMTRKLISQTRGSAIEPFAWAMPATVFAYFAWSFVEFSFDDKPFWEFLALFTALYLLVQRMVDAGEVLPGLDEEPKPLPWQRKKETDP
jgi:O-antigen ligase